MVSEDSDLYREHPDWAITIPGRKPVRSRNQLVLDFSRKEVRDEIFKRICAVLDQGNVEYIKWDMNRSLADIYAPNVTYDYVLGVYDFLENLRTVIRIFLLKAAAEAAEDLMPECCIIRLRSGAVTTQMLLIVHGFNMESPSFIR